MIGFTKVMFGGQIITLRVGEDFEWRRDTIENPAWLDENRSGRIRMAALIWCMLEGKYKGLDGVQDVWKVYKNAANQSEIENAAIEAWRMANPEAKSKNESGSTESPPTPSS